MPNTTPFNPLDAAAVADARDLPMPAGTDWLKLDVQLCFALYSTSLLASSYAERHRNLDSGTLTPLLKRLEASGFIERRRALADERRVEIHLTPVGLALRDQAIAIPEQLACASACGPAELESLTKRLHELRANVLTHLARDPDHPVTADEDGET